MKLRYQAVSDIGLVRKNNQDSGYASPTTLIVADGMGGAAAGDLASRIAVSEFHRADAPKFDKEMLDSISDSLAQINAEISKKYTANHEVFGMGTTVTGLKFDGEKYGLVNIGDSRTYLIRDGEISRLTHDHSFVQELIDQGQITEAEAHTHPNRSWILKVLDGINNFEPDFSLITAQLGDRLVVCSDGLCGLVSDAEIFDVVTDTEWEKIPESLVAKALAAGGQDNVTVVLGEVVSEDTEVATEPLVVGAAKNIVEDSTEKTSEIPLVRPDPQTEEITRYRPKLKRFGNFIPILIGCLATALVIIGGIFAAKVYIDSNSHYFLAPEDGKQGKIVVWHGIPDMNWVNSVVASPSPKVLMEEVLRSDREKLLSKYRVKVSDINVGLRELHQMQNRWQKCIAAKKAQEVKNEAHPVISASPTPSPINNSNSDGFPRPRSTSQLESSSAIPISQPNLAINPSDYLPGEC